MLMVAYSIAIASTRNFVPDEMMFINVYMMLVGLVVMPKMLFAYALVLAIWCANIPIVVAIMVISSGCHLPQVPYI